MDHQRCIAARETRSSDPYSSDGACEGCAAPIAAFDGYYECSSDNVEPIRARPSSADNDDDDDDDDDGDDDVNDCGLTSRGRRSRRSDGKRQISSTITSTLLHLLLLTTACSAQSNNNNNNNDLVSQFDQLSQSEVECSCSPRRFYFRLDLSATCPPLPPPFPPNDVFGGSDGTSGVRDYTCSIGPEPLPGKPEEGTSEDLEVAQKNNDIDDNEGNNAGGVGGRRRYRRRVLRSSSSSAVPHVPPGQPRSAADYFPELDAFIDAQIEQSKVEELEWSSADFTTSQLDTDIDDNDDDDDDDSLQQQQQYERDDVPVSIYSIQFLEVDTEFNVINQDSSYVRGIDFASGQLFNYTSASSSIDDGDDGGSSGDDAAAKVVVVGGMNMVLRGVNARGAPVRNVFTITYTNDCDVATFDRGESIGWVVFENFVPASSETCDAPIDTLPPTFRPTESPPPNTPFPTVGPPEPGFPTTDMPTESDFTLAPITPFPTLEPTPKPTTRRPTTRRPTRDPTRDPTRRPTAKPTRNPTRQPTKNPTRRPSNEPTANPTRMPTKRPTKTASPTREGGATTSFPTPGDETPSRNPTTTRSPTTTRTPTTTRRPQSAMPTGSSPSGRPSRGSKSSKSAKGTSKSAKAGGTASKSSKSKGGKSSNKAGSKSSKSQFAGWPRYPPGERGGRRRRRRNTPEPIRHLDQDPHGGRGESERDDRRDALQGHRRRR